MKRHFSILCLFLCISLYVKGEVKVVEQKINMITNPQGVAINKVNFSWQLFSNEFNVKQTSYQIEVACSEEDLLAGRNLYWISPIVYTSKSIWIAYDGKLLLSGKDYYWRVNVWTDRGMVTSPIAQWSTALLESEWHASWIGIKDSLNFSIDDKKRTRLPARYLRKEFKTKEGIKRAMLYIAGLGSSVTYINGKSITDDVFGSLPTFYKKSVMFNTYNVTSFLNSNGKNAIGVLLGNGRFQTVREPGARGFGFPRLLAQLVIEYKDGEKETVISDATWKATYNGPIVANNEFDGEEYVAHLELGDWTLPSYKSTWKNADIMSAPGGKLTPQLSPSLKIKEEIYPLALKATDRNTYILDMGQNMVGWLKVKLRGKKDKPISFRFAETLTADGTQLYTANLRSALANDIYTPKQTGIFTWEPSLVYHGFRYVEITGLDDQPDLDAFTGKVIYDDMNTIGSFETSNDILNQIYHNAYWGIRGNYRGMPTDCPQRDERIAWLGDRATGSYGESFIFNNDAFYHKWLFDIEESMNENGSISDVSPRFWGIYSDDVTWPCAYFYIADILHSQFGDSRAINEHYYSMKIWLNHITNTCMKDYIITKNVYGDWCMPPESPELIHSKDPSRITKGEVLSTAVFYKILQLMQKFALIRKQPGDAQGYADLAAKIKNAYNEKFFNRTTAQYDNNTVTANLLSLYFGMVPQGYEQKVFDNIVTKTENDFDGHVSTGVIGIQQLMRGLSRFGNPELAYSIATNITYPSWGYMVQKDATTIWELWNGNTANPAMNSGNHVMLLGDLVIWFYEDLAGIKTDTTEVGFKKFLLSPTFPKDLKSAKASYDCPYGMIKSDWTRNGNKLKWKISIPANTSATVQVPAIYNIEIASPNITYKIWKKNQNNILELGSGDYILQSKE